MNLKTLAAAATLATAAFATRAEEVPLYITDIKAHIPNQDVLTLTWNNYTTITGFKIYYRESLQSGEWLAVKAPDSGDSNALILPDTGFWKDTDGSVILPLNCTNAVLPLLYGSDRGFFRLAASYLANPDPLSGGGCDCDPGCACDLDIITVPGSGLGDPDYIYVNIGTNSVGDAIHIKLGEDGLAESPPTFWLDPESTPPWLTAWA